MRPRLALAAPRRARVEIIPLIDVVFFLLAAFVLFTFMMTHSQSLLVTLPQTPPKPAPLENVVLQVSADGAAYWNQEPISLADLPARLTAYKQSTADPRILLTGDDKAKWGPLVSALDEVQKAGIKNFSIETRPRPTGR